MKLSEIELDFLYEKSAELFRDKVKQLGKIMNMIINALALKQFAELIYELLQENL